MDETILGMQARKRETIGLAVGDGTARPTHVEDGAIDQEMLDLTRLDDIDEESEVYGGSDDDSSSDTDADTDTDSADNLSGDEGEDEDDSDYEGASDTDAAILSFGGLKTRSGTSGEAQYEESEDDMDLGDK